jgi:beta-aspartyl-peptidase (threonine type)
MQPVIIVNGGAGSTKYADRRRKGVKQAVEAGYALLENGTALDAVEKAVIVMEDYPVFNAGTGSTLSLDGKIEMDACVMCSDQSMGAVAAIKDVKNPIAVARKVMEETDHILLAGEGATQFARKMGFPYYDPLTPARKKLWEESVRQLRHSKSHHYFNKLGNFLESTDTVGAVAIDKEGKIACACSTGGITLHLQGRVGDTPLLGAGNYANEFGGASATGHGECIAKLLLSKTAVDLMKKYTAQTALSKALEATEKFGCRFGIIAIDKKGDVGAAYNTEWMPYAYIGKDGRLKRN